MTNSKTVQLDVQLNTNEIEIGTAVIRGLLSDLKQITEGVVSALSKAVNPDLGGLNSIQIGFVSMANDLDTVAEKMTELVTLMAPQKETFLDGLVSSVGVFNTLARGRQNIEDITKTINESTKNTNNSFFSIIKTLIPNSLESFRLLSSGITKAFSGINVALNGSTLIWGVLITAVIAGIALIIANWDSIKADLATVGEWLNTNVLQPVVNFFTGVTDWISTKVQECMTFVQNIFAGISEFMQGVFAKDWTEQFGIFGNVLNAFFTNVENIWNAIKNVFSGIVSFVKNVFAGEWGAAWDSIVSIFKGIWDYLVACAKVPINNIFGFLNCLLAGAVAVINSVIDVLNGISFDVPDWVPIIGGQTFAPSLTPLVAPQIPYLAQGAVLPANKPFLAMVGDQRHGTNVEAPLATIQEAVALVMEDQFNGMMAGFEAVTARQEQILETLLGIEIGDTTIGQAAARYNRKMAIIKGGM